MIINLSKRLYNAITESGTRSFWILIFFLIITSLFEMMGVVSVMPFIAAVSNPSFLEQVYGFPLLGEFVSDLSREHLIAVLGTTVIIMAWSVSFISASTNIRLLKFGYGHEETFSGLLFKHYLKLDHSEYSVRAVSELSKNVLHETHRMVHGVLVPWILLIAKSISGITLTILLLMVNWKITLICGGLVGGGVCSRLSPSTQPS